jgi:hypothetical protein
MKKNSEGHTDWVNRGKSIKQLIRELQRFEDQDAMVEISLDSGDTSKPISLVVRSGGLCLLVYADD